MPEAAPGATAGYLLPCVFYPDFICQLPDGEILIVEYKGGQGWTGAQDDRDIGALWAALSDGSCHFVMVRNKDWAQVEAML